MGLRIRRFMGQILLDGRFMSKNDLDHALEEQKRTKELLGQVLVRMGVLRENEINAPLMIQRHLGNIDDAVRIAAGERQLLGALLVQSGHISADQLDYAIDEQKRTGEKLGKVFKRLGMLTERQLSALLDFQKKQGDINTVGPLRLGELLLATGHISREQLDDALHKQRLSHKKIGEILIEEGYLRPERVTYGVRLQKMLVNSVLAAILSLGMGASGFASSVNLEWDPNTESDLEGYKVYYTTESSSFDGTTPMFVSKDTTKATVSGLDPGKSYKFAVTAYNSSELESSYSNIVLVAEQSPPVVAITSPSNAQSVSNSVNVSVDVSDNAGVTKVEYYVDGLLKSTETDSPFGYSWDTSQLAYGSHTIMARAYDAAGNSSDSSRSVSVVNDFSAPVVALIEPANNSSVSGTVAIKSNASDNVGVTRVDYYCNNMFLFTGNVSPYLFNWDTGGVSNGSYTIVAKAYDGTGNSAQSTSVTVTVKNPVPDVTPPVLNSFALPSTAVSMTVAVSSFTASDNTGVSGYLITESATPPAAGAAGWSSVAPTTFTFSSEGAKTAYAWVKDAAGNVSSSRSSSVNITLPDSIAPSVALSNPVANSTVNGNVAIAAVATDNVSVDKVEFYINGILKATSSGSQYSFIWDTSGVVNGSYTILAKAYDASGNTAQSSSVKVLVDNAVPSAIEPTIVDASLALQVAVGKVKPTNEQKARLDLAPIINGKSVPDGKVNTGDAIVILSKIVGKTK